jgi:hypothetical protein
VIAPGDADNTNARNRPIPVLDVTAGARSNMSLEETHGHFLLDPTPTSARLPERSA